MTSGLDRFALAASGKPLQKITPQKKTCSLAEGHHRHSQPHPGYGWLWDIQVSAATVPKRSRSRAIPAKMFTERFVFIVVQYALTGLAFYSLRFMMCYHTFSEYQRMLLLDVVHFRQSDLNLDGSDNSKMFQDIIKQTQTMVK